MNFVKKHPTFWKIVVVVASIALIASSLMPFFGGLQY
jgi:hypothetical protein